MSIALAILVFGGGAVLLIYLLDRLLRLRGSEDESVGSYDHWSDGQIRSSDHDLGDGD